MLFASTAPTSRVSAVRSGKMPTTSVRRRISRLSRSWGLLDQICRHAAFGNAVKAKMSARAASRCCAIRGWSASASEDPVELGVHRVGVGLVVDRVQQSLDPAPRALGGGRHQVRRVMGAAPLPAGAGQGGADRLDEATMGVAGDQDNPVRRGRPGRGRRRASRRRPLRK